MNLHPTPNQIEVLADLEHIRYRSSHKQEWATPLDMGASNGSHHSSTLRALVKKGLVEWKQRCASNDEIGGLFAVLSPSGAAE